ncbi:MULTISPECIES: fimbrial protein [Rahnella]|uniref:fimbrial protein n=1 Tax=Rahnella TaxID=34037 RepID=UPI000DC22C63|nr:MULTISPECIES: fimbrial protein [Rahnella]MCM2444767.1 type 1 fimbrial protein [Rahnella sp. CG8]QQN35996.1 type 1 fimbrial protein [Rahnella aceris]
MKINTFFKMSVLAAGMVAALGANAADGTINVGGTIIETGCQVDAASIAAPVALGDMASTSFPTIGSISAKKDINVVLTECPVTQSGVSLIALGAADATNNELLALNDESTAAGLGIALYNMDGSLIPMNSSSAVASINAETGSATIAMQAAAMSTAEKVTAGAFTATTNFSLTYN